MKTHVYILIFLIMWTGHSFAQESDKSSANSKNNALKVFITTNDDDFSIDFIKKEIPVINYVRDQKDAHVLIIATTQRTGAGGYEYAYFLTGQHDFSGMADTLKYTSSPEETLEKTREGQISVLKMGLLRYIMRTPHAGNVQISFTDKAPEEISDDPWNNWVIRLFLGGELRGRKQGNIQISGEE